MDGVDDVDGFVCEGGCYVGVEGVGEEYGGELFVGWDVWV